MGAPLSAGLIGPWGLAFDAASAALFIADQFVIRYADFVSGLPDNVVTVAGGATKSIPGVASTNAPNHWLPPGPNNIYLPNTGAVNAVGTHASFSSLNNVVAVHATRMLYIADSGNSVIRSMTYYL